MLRSVPPATAGCLLNALCILIRGCESRFAILVCHSVQYFSYLQI